MNGLGVVYFYIDVVKDEIEMKESLPDTPYVGGELFQMRTALSRFEQVATVLEGDRAEKMTQECIAKIIEDVKGEKHGIHSKGSVGGNGNNRCRSQRSENSRD